MIHNKERDKSAVENRQLLECEFQIPLITETQIHINALKKDSNQF